jgi:hypothetical protein
VRYFELIGLPGAGKTTLLRGWQPVDGIVTIHQLIRRERVRSARTHHRPGVARLLPPALALRLLRGPEPGAYDTARFMVDHPALHDLVTATAARVHDEEERLVALWMLVEAWSRHAYAGRVGSPDGGVILDEGIWQRLGYLAAVSGRDGARPLAFPDDHPRTDGVIVVACSAELAAERLRSRATEFQASHLLPAMDRALETISAHLSAQGVPITVVDAAGPRAEALAHIRGFLRGAGL